MANITFSKVVELRTSAAEMICIFLDFSSLHQTSSIGWKYVDYE